MRNALFRSPSHHPRLKADDVEGKIVIGIISNENIFVRDHLDNGPGNEEIYNFSISNDKLSFIEIMNSVFSTPGRYVMEIFSRLSSLPRRSHQRIGTFIFNPLMELSPKPASFLFSYIRRYRGGTDIRILGDAHNVPLGYYFPEAVEKDERKYLSLLSCVDSRLDGEYLGKVFFLPVREDQVNVPGANPLQTNKNNRFKCHDEFKEIYLWTTKSAIRVLDERPHFKEKERNEEIRDAIPFAWIMPYHAGDVLFFSLAAGRVRSHISAIVVHEAYADIVAKCAPRLKPILYKPAVPPPERDRTDEDCFFEVVRHLPGNNFYGYGRPARDHKETLFHFVDQFAFALGRDFLNGDLLINTLPRPTAFRPYSLPGPFRILLHFGGGWPLKVYPESYQEELINLLISKRFRVTVLHDQGGKRWSQCDCRSFSGMLPFIELLETHHLLVGMDSFPCHYAAFIHGLPTICLFANTRPINAAAPLSGRHLYLEKGYSCRPCRSRNVCPAAEVHHDGYCGNFVEPKTVGATIETMLKDLYGNPGIDDDE